MVNVRSPGSRAGFSYSRGIGRTGERDARAYSPLVRSDRPSCHRKVPCGPGVHTRAPKCCSRPRTLTPVRVYRSVTEPSAGWMYKVYEPGSVVPGRQAGGTPGSRNRPSASVLTKYVGSAIGKTSALVWVERITWKFAAGRPSVSRTLPVTEVRCLRPG